MSSQITVSLPDGSQRQVPTGATAADLAAEIGAGLAKAAVIAEVNGEERDLTHELADGDVVAIVTANSDQGLYVIRHSTAHVLAQAVLGGITVLTGLSPLVVAAHFLLSMVLIAIAVALYERAREVALYERAREAADPAPAAPADAALLRTGLRWATTALAVAAAAVLVLGTLVTAAGPHAGDPGTVRLGLDIRLIAIAHADAVWLLVGLTVALVAVTWRHGPPRLRTAVRALLVIELLQGTLGYTQYALGVPAPLVAAHILGAAVLWATTVAVWVRARPGPVAAPTPVPAAAADAVP
jgi:cytochrome c oxidase assembly protein subunit 15